MNAIFQDISIPQKDFLLAMKAMGERRNIPNISWNTAEYLFSLFHGKNVKNILEIGPANGFSTLILGISCSEAQIVSIECSRHAFEELRQNVKTFYQLGMTNCHAEPALPSSRLGLASQEIDPEIVIPDPDPESGGRECGWDSQVRHPRLRFKTKNDSERNTTIRGQIIQDNPLFSPAELGPKVTSSINQEIIGNHQLYYADARKILPAFQKGSSAVTCENPQSELCDIPKLQFDFIFIDGAFRMTRDFFDLSFPLLQSGGTIIIDDAIKYAWKMDGFQEYLQSINIPYKLIQTDADDGIMLIEMK